MVSRMFIGTNWIGFISFRFDVRCEAFIKNERKKAMNIFSSTYEFAKYRNSALIKKWAAANSVAHSNYSDDFTQYQTYPGSLP